MIKYLNGLDEAKILCRPSGQNDIILLSNTLHLEPDGVCFEGNPEYLCILGRYRNCSIVGTSLGGKPGKDGKEAEAAFH